MKGCKKLLLLLDPDTGGEGDSQSPELGPSGQSYDLEGPRIGGWSHLQGVSGRSWLHRLDATVSKEREDMKYSGLFLLPALQCLALAGPNRKPGDREA